jgi:DNA (cytosine-5)-methyltransferase 1
VGEPMSHVDLCSGIGGFALGFEWAGLSKPVLFCDIEPWSRKVLAKHWPDVPIADDVKELANDPARLVPDCDILTAGYPCQPFSVAGKQRGTEDDRHLWPFISQIIAHKRPAWCVLENVYGHVALGLDEVLADLEAQDYATRAFIVPACGVNAPHRRDRLWIIAHTNSHGEPDGTINEKQRRRKLVGNPKYDGSSAATVSGKHGQDEARCAEGQSASEQSEGASEPGHYANVGNAAHNVWNGGAAQAQRERAAHQSDQSQSGLWGKSIGSGQNVADTDSSRQQQSHKEMAERSSEQFDSGSFQSRKNVADTDNKGSQGRLSGRQGAEWQGEHGHARCSGTAHRQSAKDWWAVEPSMGRVAHGIPGRVDRLKGLGNAIVPQIAMQIGLTIKAVRDA